jgi:predicted phosphoribosyltransferase
MEAERRQAAMHATLASCCWYRDRFEAGAKLADTLHAYRDHKPIVVGISPGGMRIAYEVAERLGGELDVMAVSTIGAPGQEEIVLGAVTSDGVKYVNASLRKLLRVPVSLVERSGELRYAEAQLRERRCRGHSPALNPAGRLVILVDDGMPTGTTMRAALRSLRARGAEKIVVAVPVASVDACSNLAHEVDELVCPQRLDAFAAAAQHYGSLEQTSDLDVELLLRRARGQHASSAPA